jgi:hypothetical protein
VVAGGVVVAITEGFVVAELVDEGPVAFVADLVVVVGLVVVAGTATALVATSACSVVVVVRGVVGAATVDPVVVCVGVVLDAVDEELDSPGPPTTSRTRTRMTPPVAMMPAPTFTSVFASNDICSP